MDTKSDYNFNIFDTIKTLSSDSHSDGILNFIKNYFYNLLPRGDCYVEWLIHIDKNNDVKAYNYFQCGPVWLPFVITIKPDYKFSIVFRGEQSKYIPVAKPMIERVLTKALSQNNFIEATTDDCGLYNIN